MPAAHQTRVLAASATRTTSGDTGAVTVSPDAELLAVHINRWGITGTAPSFTFSVSDYARVRTL